MPSSGPRTVFERPVAGKSRGEDWGVQGQAAALAMEKREKRTNAREEKVRLVVRHEARGAADDGHRGFCE